MDMDTNFIANTNKIIIELLKNSLFNIDFSNNVMSICNQDIWHDVYREASMHCVDTLIFQGIMNLPKDIRPEKDILEKWRNTTIIRMLHNEYLIKEQTNVLGYLTEAGINSVILKGTSVSYFYPSPELRPLGDIDILINKGEYEAAANVLYKNGYVFDNKHDFHLVVRKSGIVVELHTEVSRYPNNEVGILLSNSLNNIIGNARQYKINNTKFPGPSPFDNAMVLLLHMQRHLNKGIGLRQLCDWIMFVNSNSQSELWNELLPFLEKIGLKKFASVLTKIGVIYLGLDSKTFLWCLEADNKVCDMLLQDILYSGNIGRKRSNEDSASGYLTDGYENTDGSTYNKIEYIKRIFKNFSKSAKRDFPFLNKYPLFLPIMCLYIPLRYIVRMIMGKRPKLTTGKLLKKIKWKNNLYKELRIFQTKF